MASIKVVLRETKVDAKGEAPLYLRITQDRKSRFKALGKRVRPKDWNFDTCRVKPSHPSFARLNAFISQKETEVHNATLDLQLKTPFVTAAVIKAKLAGNGKGQDFFYYAESYLRLIKETKAVATYKKMRTAVEKLKEYVKGAVLCFHELTPGFLTKYEAYLKSYHNNGPNTVHTDLKNLRRLVNAAILDDVVEVGSNPFLRYKLKTVPTHRAFLDEEELLAFQDVTLDQSKVIYHHQQAYVFACYAGGLRVSDTLQLRWKNYDGTHLALQIHKTKAPLSIKLPQKALEILNKYRGDSVPPADAFIFPLLKINPTEDDKRKVFDAISSATAYLNKDLKVIAKLAGIEKKVTFHTSRHTWATRALRKGMRIEYVSKLMGHADIKETQVYAKIINSELDKAMGVFDI